MTVSLIPLLFRRRRSGLIVVEEPPSTSGLPTIGSTARFGNYPVDRTGQVRLLNATTYPELWTLMRDANPGDTIETSLKLDHGANLGTLSVIGTASNPIRVVGTSPNAGVVSTTDSATRPFKFDAIEHVEFYNLDLDGGFHANWCLGFPGRWSSDPDDGPMRNVGLYGLKVHDSLQAAIGLGGTICDDVEIKGCEVYWTADPSPARGSAIYVGTGGARGVSYPRRILIEGNYLHDVYRAEAVDVKWDAADVTIRGNLIMRIETNSQGAIDLAVNDTTNRPAGYDPADYLVENNVIMHVTHAGSEGDGITIGDAATVRNNIIADVGRMGIGMSSTFPATDTPVTVEGNTFWDIGGAEIIEPGPPYPYNFNGFETTALARALNIGPAGKSPDHTAVVADFLGPLTGDYDNGAGPGSALLVAAASALPATAGAFR